MIDFAPNFAPLLTAGSLVRVQQPERRNLSEADQLHARAFRCAARYRLNRHGL
jgi:hypothetical protein